MAAGARGGPSGPAGLRFAAGVAGQQDRTKVPVRLRCRFQPSPSTDISLPFDPWRSANAPRRIAPLWSRSRILLLAVSNCRAWVLAATPQKSWSAKLIFPISSYICPALPGSGCAPQPALGPMSANRDRRD